MFGVIGIVGVWLVWLVWICVGVVCESVCGEYLWLVGL